MREESEVSLHWNSCKYLIFFNSDCQVSQFPKHCSNFLIDCQYISKLALNGIKKHRMVCESTSLHISRFYGIFEIPRDIQSRIKYLLFIRKRSSECRNEFSIGQWLPNVIERLAFELKFTIEKLNTKH